MAHRHPARQQQSPDRMGSPRSLWGWWTAASAIGGGVIGFLEDSGFQFMATLVFTGIVIGAAQWMVLRCYVRRMRRWMLMSALGWLTGVQVSILLGDKIDSLVYFLTQLGGWEVLWLNLINRSIILAILGVAQWVALRRHVEGANWWIGASAIAGLIQGGISASLCAAACSTMAHTIGAGLSTAIVYGAGWMGYGVITGLVLEQLFQRSIHR